MSGIFNHICWKLKIIIAEQLSTPEKTQLGHDYKFNKHNFSASKNSKIMHHLPDNTIKINLLDRCLSTAGNGIVYYCVIHFNFYSSS